MHEVLPWFALFASVVSAFFAVWQMRKAAREVSQHEETIVELRRAIAGRVSESDITRVLPSIEKGVTDVPPVSMIVSVRCSC